MSVLFLSLCVGGIFNLRDVVDFGPLHVFSGHFRGRFGVKSHLVHCALQARAGASPGGGALEALQGLSPDVLQGNLTLDIWCLLFWGSGCCFQSFYLKDHPTNTLSFMMLCSFGSRFWWACCGCMEAAFPRQIDEHCPGCGSWSFGCLGK